MAFEYIGIYDGMKTADRIKYLGLGYQIFDNHGKGFFGYQQFHTKRIKKMGFVEFIFRTLLIVLAFFVLKRITGLHGGQSQFYLEPPYSENSSFTLNQKKTFFL